MKAVIEMVAQLLVASRNSGIGGSTAELCPPSRGRLDCWAARARGWHLLAVRRPRTVIDEITAGMGHLLLLRINYRYVIRRSP